MIYYIRGKSPVDIKILNDNNYIENALLLSSKDINILNNIEIENLNDNSFDIIFDNAMKRNNDKFNISFKNCKLKKVRMDKIPFHFNN